MSEYKHGDLVHIEGYGRPVTYCCECPSVRDRALLLDHSAQSPVYILKSKILGPWREKLKVPRGACPDWGWGVALSPSGGRVFWFDTEPKSYEGGWHVLGASLLLPVSITIDFQCDWRDSATPMSEIEWIEPRKDGE